MTRVDANPRISGALPQKNELPSSLKALIVAVAAVSAAALGFWLAGFAGLCVGLAGGAGMGFAAVQLFSCNFRSAEEIVPPLKDAKLERNTQPLTEIALSREDDIRSDPYKNLQALRKLYFGANPPKIYNLRNDRAAIANAPPLTDIEFASDDEIQSLIEFFNLLPFPQKQKVQGPIKDQALAIQTWMQQSPQIQNCETLQLSQAIENYEGLQLAILQGLTQIPKEIGLFKNLKCLTLDANQLQTLPREIGNLQALTQLSLLGNRLRALPPEIGRLQALKILNLAYNLLESVPAEIGNLRALSHLYLSDNQLKALPAEIGQLQALALFFLAGNQLQTLPREIGNLQALKQLDLYDNQLQALPRGLGNLQALTFLQFGPNQLQALLPAQIGNLHHRGEGIYEI